MAEPNYIEIGTKRIFFYYSEYQSSKESFTSYNQY